MGNKRGSTTTRGARGRKAQQQKKRRFGSGILDFTRDVRAELRRVSWPNRDQLRQSTAVVLIVVITLGIYVTVWDYIFQFLSNLVFLGG